MCCSPPYVKTIASKIGLTISFEKTEIISLKPMLTKEIAINYRTVKLVAQFKYYT